MSDVMVIGAGVIGLTSGIRLAERGRRVRILTDSSPSSTTSAAATAMIGLAFAEPFDRVQAWEAATMRELNAVVDDPSSGIRRQRCLLASRTTDARPPGIESWPGFRAADPRELPGGFPHGCWIDMFVADMAAYLPYLVARFEAAGGSIQTERVESFDHVEGPIVVNCAGMGARDLADDASLTGVWGMHVIVKNPGDVAGFMEGPPGEETWVGWMPHGDRVLIGGVTVAEPAVPDADLIGDRLLAAASGVDARFGGVPVLGRNSGVRPSRSVIRVEVDDCAEAPVVVHNYGHGSLGVTLAWGCADDVAAFVDSVVGVDEQ